MPVMPISRSDTQHTPGMRSRLVNMYAEPVKQGPTPALWLPRPALVVDQTLNGGPIRCSFVWNGHRFTVSGVTVFYDSVAIGSILGDDLCRFGISDDEIVIVGSGKAYYVTTTSVAVILDPDLPANVVDVVFLAGRFVYLDRDSARFVWSDLGDAQSIDGASFATAGENSAEKLVGAAVLTDQIVFFLQVQTEWWYATSDPDNPFQYSQGRRYNKGLAARDTTVLVDNTVFFVGSDRIVYRAGSVPQVVSSFSMGDRLNKVSDEDLVSCSAFGLTHNNHTFYVLHLPTQGSWACDIVTGEWANWSSWGFDRFRVTTGAVADPLVGDKYSGSLMRWSTNVYTDVDDPFERTISAYIGVQSGSLRNFNVYLNCVRGVGLVSGYGSDPVVEMRFSDGEGSDFSNWLEAPLGIQGDHSDAAKAIWAQLGLMNAPGRLFEFRCTDPVYFGVSSAQFNVDRP